MAKSKHITITEDGVITQEALLAYAAGQLSPAETEQIEKLLRDDPFAQDALEGMRSAAAPPEMKTVVSSLNIQLREKTGVREKKKKGIEIHWATYAYAAVIVGILIGLGFVMVHFISDSEQRIAMNKTATQAQESVPVPEEKPVAKPATDSSQLSLETKANAPTYFADSAKLSGSSSVSAASGTYTITAADANKSMAVSQTTQPSGFSSTTNNVGTVAPPSAAKAEQSQNGLYYNPGRADASPAKLADNKAKTGLDKDKEATVVYEKKAVAKKESSISSAPTYAWTSDTTKTSSKLMDQVVSTESSNLKVSKSPASTLALARALFDAADYKAAAKKYNEVLDQQPDNADALYFGGISDYLNGRYKPAEKNFDKLLKANLYVDGSKYYKAIILVDRGKKEEAKQLLRDLINTNSSFKDRAVKKYEEILK